MLVVQRQRAKDVKSGKATHPSASAPNYTTFPGSGMVCDPELDDPESGILKKCFNWWYSVESTIAGGSNIPQLLV
jgi:hypothetical protein